MEVSEKKYKLKIITSTVREGRKGPAVAEWVAEVAKKTTDFDIEVVDLGLLNLPLSTEPNHPRLGQYLHDATKKWSSTISQADAFIFVTAEYNHSLPAPLKNALDTLSLEWGYKPAGIVSYAGVSAGTRAANALIEVLTTLRMVPLLEAVHIPFFTQYINAENQKFEPGEITATSAIELLKELKIWTKGLHTIREEKKRLSSVGK